MTSNKKKSARLAGFWLACLGLAAAQAQVEDAGSGSLMLVNGRIHTLDADNTVVGSVLLHGGRVVAVGDDLDEPAGSIQVIDLNGRTAIPGLIDSHVHFIRAGLRPGHDLRGIESARSIGELQAALAARAVGISDGEFITGVGGWNPFQFRENRFPTLAELDEAAPGHPVYIHLRANGPAVTSSAGRRFLEAEGIIVAENGMIAAGGVGAGPGNAVEAYDVLKSYQTE